MRPQGIPRGLSCSSKIINVLGVEWVSSLRCEAAGEGGADQGRSTHLRCCECYNTSPRLGEARGVETTMSDTRKGYVRWKGHEHAVTWHVISKEVYVWWGTDKYAERRIT